MEKFKGTPGPWTPNPKAGLSNVKYGDVTICHMVGSRKHVDEDRKSGESWLAMMGRNEPLRKMQAEESESNCRLIAASPELLELAFKYKADMLNIVPKSPARDNRILEIDRVINKALGLPINETHPSKTESEVKDV